MKITHNRPVVFLLYILALLVMFAALYVSAFTYQLGSHVKAEWWVKHAYIYKEHLAKRITSKKLIVIGGSNAMFGLDSEMLESKVGIPVVNLAVHAALGVDFMYYKILDHLGEGDVVVLPLELKQFVRDGYTEMQVNNFTAWGWDDYLSRLSLLELADFIINTPKRRILNGVIKQDGENPLLSEEEVIGLIDGMTESRLSIWNGYDHKSLNSRGDILVDEDVDAKMKKQHKHGINYFPKEEAPSETFMDFHVKLQRAVDEHNGRLIYTWPVMIRNERNDYSKQATRSAAEEFSRSLGAHGIRMSCNPAMFTIGIKFFFNTRYHTNVYGAEIRTDHLAECLNAVLRGNNTVAEDDYDSALEKVKEIEDRQSKRLAWR